VGDKLQSNNSVVHPFEPISNEHSRILILGTMPSVQSRKADFYYSHPRNRFWQMLAICLGQPLPLSVNEKIKLLLSNKIALWDVLSSCEISGSDDSSIRNPIFNDIAALINNRPIEKILCNGKKSHSLCVQLGLPVPVLCVPSTSPANAAWNLECLIEAWKAVLL
jgi:hypoxanthine-DNA glycosylase